MIQIFRGTFSAAHFYHQPQWGPEKNHLEFGKCFSPFGHGHDYRIELTIKLSDSLDDVKQLSSLQEIFAGVLHQLDHHHLNFVLPEFKKQIPTTENLALYIQEQILRGIKNLNELGDIPILKIRLYETSDLWVEMTVG